MIDKTDIRRHFHDHAIVLTVANKEGSLSGRIVDDTPEDHCVIVRDPDLVRYYETKCESLLERVYFKDLKSIHYQ